MEKIQLHSVLPQVFAQREDLHSEIWKQDVTFEKGHLYLVEAESGSGKSTFCSYVLGYRHDYSGSVMFDNDVTANYKVSDWVEMRKRHISHLFQELRLFPELTAMENVEIKNKITGFKSREQILQWFDMLGIADKVDAKVSNATRSPAAGMVKAVSRARTRSSFWEYSTVRTLWRMPSPVSRTIGRLRPTRGKRCASFSSTATDMAAPSTIRL